MRVLIVGGGMQGVIIARALTAIMPREQLRILDPHPQLLHIWRHNCAACGMQFLRSPGAHTIDTDFHSLFAFARQQGVNAEGTFLPRYKRPSLSLFMAHAASVIASQRLDTLHLQGRVEHIELGRQRVRVGYRAADGTAQTLQADTLLLAIGRAEWPVIPKWAPDVAEHIFAPQFRADRLVAEAAPVIVGGGMSAVQLALRIAARRNDGQPVRIISRHAIRMAHFDSDPCYIGHKCLQRFLDNSDWEARRREIDAARAGGSLTWEIARRLQEALDTKRIALLHGTVHTARRAHNGTVELTLDTDRRLHATSISLATGFRPVWAHIPLIATLAHRYHLPVDRHGWPLPDRFLRWGTRLFVCGALAELELGPAAPNIIGAHLALRRLLPLLRGTPEASIARSVAWQPLQL